MFQGHDITRNAKPATVGRRVGLMPGTLWCTTNDPEMNYTNLVGHPFPDTDPERRHFEETTPKERLTGNSYGRPTYQKYDEVTAVVDICGYHWSKQNPFLAKKEIPGPEKPTQATLHDLEMEDETYRRGFEAGEDHAMASKR